jgi:hypothetical protein
MYAAFCQRAVTAETRRKRTFFTNDYVYRAVGDTTLAAGRLYLLQLSGEKIKTPLMPLSFRRFGTIITAWKKNTVLR